MPTVLDVVRIVQAEGRPVRSLVSEQIYGGFAGEQFLVEGLY